MKAEEAKALSEKVRNNIPDLDFCLSRIKADAERGKNKSVFNCKINNRAIHELEKLGYQVKEDEYNDLYVNW